MSHREPELLAKHKLVMTGGGKKQVHICDVSTWDDDSPQVQHGISGMLQVTSRYTPSKAVKDFPRFRLTLSAKADAAQVLPFLNNLRRNKQAAVIVLNNRGWVGYLVAHEANPKLYCHFHYQENMDAGRQKVRSQQTAKMSRLARIQRGPWDSPHAASFNRERGGVVDGPDYDPALVYSMDDLDPYRDMPPPPEEPLLPAFDAVEEDTEMAAILSGVRERQAEIASVRRDRGQGQGGQSIAGRREGGRGSAQAEAAAKYGEELRTEAQQASSFIYHLKRFNNWVKATLISKASKDTATSGLRVLDLACGKGGDLGKWAAHPDGIEKYVGSDIAFGSLQHLVERMAKSSEKGGRMNWRKVPVKLFEADLGSNDVQRDRVRVWENNGGRPGEWDDRVPLNEGDLFDVASMQFALHYMGQTEARMRRFMHEVSRHLRIGGIFIATTMDSRVLIQLLMGQAEQSWDSARSRTTLKVEFEDERKHNLLSIAFKDPYESYLRQHSQDGDACGPFGLEYTFTLRETELNKNAVDEVPEWMLPLDALKDVAADYGLELETAQNFHEFYAQESQADPARMNLRNMHVFNPQGSMNSTEWRIAGIYMALVFRKTSTAMRPVGASAPASPPSPSGSAPRQHAPVSPTMPPPGWEGPQPKFQPTSPDHPPPNLPTTNGDFMDVRTNSAFVPRSPQHAPPNDVAFTPQSPTSPPPRDADVDSDGDSDDDTMYNNALAEARNSVPPEEWDAFPPDRKQACIEEQMRLMK